MQFHAGTADVTGKITLPTGVNHVTPGETATLTVELLVPVVLEEGSTFDMHDGSAIIAVGSVTKVLR